LNGKDYVYIDGTCEIDLPPGPITIEATKGPEFVPLSVSENLTKGKLSLRLTLQRWTDLHLEGWYSGDGRAHFLTPHAAWLEGAGEGLDVVNLLARADTFHAEADANLLAFSGQQPVLLKNHPVVVVNTHNFHPVLGSLGLLNCHRVVFPLKFGGLEKEDSWTLADWAQQCHRKSGLVVWTEPGQGPSGLELGEPLADLLLGKIDALEITADPLQLSKSRSIWYDLLQAGLQIPLMGSSGKVNSRSILGNFRTYAHLQPGAEFSYGSWIEAVRLGRTFITNGPLLTLTANGQGIGSRMILPEPGNVRIQAHSTSPISPNSMEVIFNGEVVASGSGSLDTDFFVPHSGWLAARCMGESLAHTSPIYVRVESKPIQPDSLVLKKFQDQARCPSEAQRHRLRQIFVEAQQNLFLPLK
jgi:hypothetical protein